MRWAILFNIYKLITNSRHYSLGSFIGLRPLFFTRIYDLFLLNFVVVAVVVIVKCRPELGSEHDHSVSSLAPLALSHGHYIFISYNVTLN